jgi:rare lipoprotein A
MSKVSIPNGREARLLVYAASCAALTAACSQSGDPPVRGMASTPSRAPLNRPLFTEEAYGVSSSPRVAGSGPIVKGGGTFKLGSPYKVAGRWYVPREEPGYDRSGVGSWYGDDFHGRKTANGEIFDKDALTAAHPTLPLPSYVYVTNLENGRTLLVRVNDRGPYVADRLIDLSHASARALGYEHRGHSQVRVRYAGRAPLNGDDRRERQFLAEQRWNTGRGAPAVAAYRPPQAPIAPPQPFPEGTAGRWSPTAYRATLAGKPAPITPKATARANDWVERQNQQSTYPGAAVASAPWSVAQSGPRVRDDAYRPGLGGPRQPPAQAPAASNRAYVQVGTYRDRANAERIRRDLSNIGPVELAPMVSGNGSELYRVRIGPMSASDASMAANRVAGQTGSPGAVVFD